MPKLLLPAWLKSVDNYTIVFNLIATYLRAFMFNKATEINEQLSTELNNFRQAIISNLTGGNSSLDVARNI